MPPNEFGFGTELESHYITVTGVKSVLITDGQGNNNASVSTAYKKLVPGVTETVVGTESMQVATPLNNTYTMRFTGNGEPIAIEDIRGISNQISDASQIVRYDDVLIETGVVAELKIVNDQVESLKYDSNGDGIPDTTIPPSRIIADPQNEDLQPPAATVNWGLPQPTRRVTVTATDSGSGVKRIYFKPTYGTTFQYVDGSSASFKVAKQFSSWSIQVVTEDNAGNRSEVVTHTIP